MSDNKPMEPVLFYLHCQNQYYTANLESVSHHSKDGAFFRVTVTDALGSRAKNSTLERTKAIRDIIDRMIRTQEVCGWRMDGFGTKDDSEGRTTITCSYVNYENT